VALVTLASRGSARAQARELAEPFTPPARPDVALDLHAGTLAPFFVGGGVRVSLPAQLVVGVLFGGVPDPYANVFGDAAESYGAGQGISELVSRMFSGAFVLRVEAGVRPVSHAGFELLVHYTALLSEPEISTTAIDQIAGQSLPWGGQSSVRLNGALHGFGGEIGWAIVPFDGVVLRLGVGLTYFAGAARGRRWDRRADRAPHGVDVHELRRRALRQRARRGAHPVITHARRASGGPRSRARGRARGEARPR
jgi:hypothetical protein